MESLFLFMYSNQFPGPSSSTGSPVKKCNTTTRVYFVGKEGNGNVNTNGHTKPTRPSEMNKHDKVDLFVCTR